MRWEGPHVEVVDVERSRRRCRARAVASRTSRASVSGANPVGSELRGDRERDVVNLARRPRRAAPSFRRSRTRRRPCAARAPARVLQASSIAPILSLVTRNVSADGARPLAEIAALVGARGAVLVLLGHARRHLPARRRLWLLGVADRRCSRGALVGDDDVEARCPEDLEASRSWRSASPRRSSAPWAVRALPERPFPSRCSQPRRSACPVELGNEEAFLLLPLYVVIAAAVARAAVPASSRGERPPPPPFLLALPLAAFVTWASTSFLWASDARAGASRCASSCSRSSRDSRRWLAARSPTGCRARSSCLVGARHAVRRDRHLAGADAHARSSRRDVEVANAYTTYFRVTSLFKDPSLYGRQLVVPSRCSWSRSSCDSAGRSTGSWRRRSWPSSSSASSSRTRSRASSRLFVVTFAVAIVGADGRAGSSSSPARSWRRSPRPASPGASIGGRSARDVTSGRSRLVTVTLDAFRERPVAGVGVGGQPRASDGDRPEGLAEPERVAHEPAHRARRARRHRLRPLPLAPRRRGLGARARLPHRPDLRRRSGRRLPRARGALAALCRVLRGSADLGRHRAHRAALATAPERSAAEEPATDTAPAAPELLAH